MGRISLARDYRVREMHSRGKEQHKQTCGGGRGGGKDPTEKAQGISRKCEVSTTGCLRLQHIMEVVGKYAGKRDLERVLVSDLFYWQGKAIKCFDRK